jgi:DNA-binding response OmpR family regulator
VALFRRAVHKAGFAVEIHVADDGDAAIRFLQDKVIQPAGQKGGLPWIELLDLKLPRRSGLEVLEWLRSQPLLRRLAVIIFTSSRESSDIAKAYELGANSYLVKPVSFDQLKEMVREVNRYWLDLNENPQGN